MAVISSWVLSACSEAEVPAPPTLIGTWQYKFVDGTGKTLDQGAIAIVDEFKKDTVWASLGAYVSMSSDDVEGEIRVINRYKDGMFQLEALFLHQNTDENVYIKSIDDDQKFDGSGVGLAFKGDSTIYDVDGKSKISTGKLTMMRTKLEVPSIKNKMNIK